MAEPFLGEIRVMSFGFAPKGWALCNGQLLPINQNMALFSLMGTTYGGDGRVNFALPNLQGRIPIHTGVGHTLGEKGGEQGHTLSNSEMPTHTHTLKAEGSAAAARSNLPTGNLASPQEANSFGAAGTSSSGAMSPGTITNVGGSQAHLNMQPFLTLNFCVALQGIFPSQT